MENPELSMLEARAEILKLLDLAPKELHVMGYKKMLVDIIFSNPIDYIII